MGVTSAHGELGQGELLRRLHGVAEKAAGLIAPSAAFSIERINHSENTTFLLTDTDTGERVILRVHRTRYHSPKAINSELTWMKALREDEGVHTPKVIPGPNGDLIHHVATDEVPEGRHCVMFEFLEGDEPDEENLLPSFPNLGEITARMHRHVRHWALPAGFERFGWNFETTLGASPHWGHWYDGPNLNEGRKAILERLTRVIRRRLEAFGSGPGRFGLIHADMRVANLLIHDGDTRVIDFDDSGIGWYLYDLASALSFIEARPDVPDLIAAWLQGYRKVESISAEEEVEIPTFLMLRRMQILAWMGSHSETDLARSLGDEYTDVTLDLTETYLSKFG
jgi:Ser/Thr protein kinase RdoA (MazF antagonist)